MPEATLAVSDQIEHGRLLSLINSMADGVISIDKDQKIVLYNGAALNVLDLNGSIDGKQLADILKPINKKKQPIDIRDYVGNIKTPKVNRDLALVYGDGSTINLYLSVTPVYLGYGRGGQDGYVLLLRDITREKSLEEERDEFISVASHELRTPIAISEGNISNAQLIAAQANEPDMVKKALEQAHEQIMFLAAMINDLATLSRAERGKLAVDIEPINVHELVENLFDSYRPETESHGLDLNVEVEPNLPPLNSSKLYVREILQNFTTNALKYTHEGSISVNAHSADGGILFKVHDSGIGISKSDQAKIFEKFFRSEDFRTRNTGGTGLGLYVTAKLARLLRAKISVESELNSGSTFSVFIPDLGTK
jgi:PAS domain S-box-containing protein